MRNSIQTADIDTLRRLAIEAWQRAESLEAEKVEAVEAKGRAVREKKVVQAKLESCPRTRSCNV